MFNFSFGEMAVVAVLALILIGPKQLPEIARTVGRFLNDLKRTGEDVAGHFFEARDQVGREIIKTREALQSTKDEMMKISKEINAVPAAHQTLQNPSAPAEAAKVSEGWKKLQVKSEIYHSIEISKKGPADGQ